MDVFLSKRNDVCYHVQALILLKAFVSDFLVAWRALMRISVDLIELACLCINIIMALSICLTCVQDVVEFAICCMYKHELGSCLQLLFYWVLLLHRISQLSCFCLSCTPAIGARFGRLVCSMGCITIVCNLRL